jgi:hypothetical protein
MPQLVSIAYPSKKLAQASAGYDELMAMSDDIILEKARVRLPSLLPRLTAHRFFKQHCYNRNKFAHRLISPRLQPRLSRSAVDSKNLVKCFISATWLTPQDPPKTAIELEFYLRNTLKKEMPRESVLLGEPLGKGEFGEVFEGMPQNLPGRSHTQPPRR